MWWTHDDDIDAPGDRDGVLNRGVAISSRSASPNESRAPAKLVKLVNAPGYQSGVAPGLCEESDGHTLQRWMAEELAAAGAHIDAFEYCPEYPLALVERYRRDSDRRKPGPGMIIDLIKRFPVGPTAAS